MSAAGQHDPRASSASLSSRIQDVAAEASDQIPGAPSGSGADGQPWQRPSPSQENDPPEAPKPHSSNGSPTDPRSSSSQEEETVADRDIEARAAERLEEDEKQVHGDVIWVEFEPNDPENPFNFSKFRKWTMTALAVFFTVEAAATASAYVPGITGMERDLNVTNHTLSLFGISIYALGFAIPPLILAPFSEVFGRRYVFLASHLLYTLFFLCCGFANNMTTMLIGRFFGGAFGSTGSTLSSGLISDIFKSHDRGTPMALFATAAIFGTGFGPLWAGWVAQRDDLGWRWIQYIQAIFTGAGFIVLCLILDETRGSVVLTRRAAKLRKDTGDERYKARAEAERASVLTMIKISLTRPLWLLASEPIVLFFSLWISTLWGVMYSLLESIGLVTALHNYNEGQNGTVFLSIIVASLIGQATNVFQNRLYEKNVARKGPEARLYMAMIAAALFPIGCFIYGWTSYPDVSIAGPVVGIIVLMTAVYHVYLAVFNYLADSYQIYASSALAAQSFARNILGGLAVPLFATDAYNNLGYQWASTLAGLLGALLGICPFVLFYFGHKIRAKSKFSLHLQELEKQGKL